MRRRDSGQAFVETAIVMPLFVFLLLGILQLSLMHQARLMTKYAAFKAARAGSIGNAGQKRMTQASIAVLLPFISGFKKDGKFYAYQARSGSDFTKNFPLASANLQENGIPHVEVRICGPTKELLGGGSEISFDDPSVATGSDWKPFDRTRLAVQVTLNYRMIIPFANMMLWNIAFGQDKANTLWVTRTGIKALPTPAQMDQERASKGLSALAAQGVYVLPIRASWGMRMQSNLFPDVSGYELPQQSDCVIPFAKN